MTTRLQFLYQFTAGPRPDLATDPSAWSPEDEEIAANHFTYLEEAADSGTVLLAGRSQDGVGPAIVILEAVSELEARTFMENDPFLVSGLFGADLHPFRVALGRSRQSPVSSRQPDQKSES
ncbi:MAG: YciI family protein [Acidimicrobiia bacterium]